MAINNPNVAVIYGEMDEMISVPACASPLPLCVFTNVYLNGSHFDKTVGGC